MSRPTIGVAQGARATSGGHWLPGVAASPTPISYKGPDIASTFFRTGLIEAWGRGYERIAEACREQGTPEPTVESDGNGVRIQWVWVNPTSDADRIRPSAGGQVGDQVGDKARESRQ